MRFYHLQPSELAKLTREEQFALTAAMPSIRAREQLEFQATVGAIFADKDKRSRFQTALAQTAFNEDPAALAVAIEAITRQD